MPLGNWNIRRRLNGLHPGVMARVRIALTGLGMPDSSRFPVRVYNTGFTAELTTDTFYLPASAPAIFTVTFTPTAPSDTAAELCIGWQRIYDTVNMPYAYYFSMDSVDVYNDTLVLLPVISTVCSDNGYRYGYNGQMKTDEIAGKGNHYTALYWEMDPRAGRRWNMDPRPNVSISYYSVFGNNPISYSDYWGDTIRASQEAFNKVNEGLNATLGDNNPVGYNAENRLLTIKSDLDKSKLNATQLEIVEKYEYLINSPTDNVEIELVKVNQPLACLGGQSLLDREWDGITADQKLIVDGKTVGTIQHIYIASNPVEIKKGTVVGLAKSYRPAFTSLHEIGHAYLNVVKPDMLTKDHNTAVEDYETRYRQIYMTPYGYYIKGKAPKHK